MATQTKQDPETVLVLGATGNIGIAAIYGALRSGRNVIAAVRNQNSAKKLSEHVSDDLSKDRITIVEADVVSDQGVQGIVDQVKSGKLPAFQHVYATVGGDYTEQGMLDTTVDELRQMMKVNFEANFSAYRATVPYLLEQPGHTTFTVCTGAQGDMGIRALPAMTQGALYSMCYAACRALKDTSVRFNEVYLGIRVEVDSEAEKNGTMPASVFGRVYEQLLTRSDIKSCRIRVVEDEDVNNLRYEQK